MARSGVPVIKVLHCLRTRRLSSTSDGIQISTADLHPSQCCIMIVASVQRHQFVLARQPYYFTGSRLKRRQNAISRAFEAQQPSLQHAAASGGLSTPFRSSPLSRSSSKSLKDVPCFLIGGKISILADRRESTDGRVRFHSLGSKAVM